MVKNIPGECYRGNVIKMKTIQLAAVANVLTNANIHERSHFNSIKTNIGNI